MKEIIAIGGCIILFTGCLGYFVNENSKIQNDFQINCIKQGGVMTLTPGRYAEVYCNINK